MLQNLTKIRFSNTVRLLVTNVRLINRFRNFDIQFDIQLKTWRRVVLFSIKETTSGSSLTSGLDFEYNSITIKLIRLNPLYLRRQGNKNKFMNAYCIVVLCPYFVETPAFIFKLLRAIIAVMSCCVILTTSTETP